MSTTPPNQPVQLSPAVDAAHESASFNRYRPAYHFQPKANWINDPCAPFFDPATSLYHVFFQWNPCLNDWGNESLAIAWGHATSYNLIDWKFDEKPALVPSEPYDIKGVFTGGFIPSTLVAANSTIEQESPQPLVLAYTSVGRSVDELYPMGKETLSLAQSHDQGATWQKYGENPILNEAPISAYTGWRDPYISYWPAVDRLMGTVENAAMYALISGGFRDHGPTAFVYKIDPNNLAKWDYISPLINLDPNGGGGKWTGDVGTNWECVNRMSLKDPNSELEREFLVISAEGTIPAQAPDGNETASEKLMVSRTPRHQLWMSGDLASTAKGGITFTPSASGMFDHGNFYAANSFRHPITGQLLAWGWVQEEDLPNDIRAEQGWSGIISMPRELYLQVHHNVSGHLGGKDLSSISVFEPLSGNGTATHGTMGIKLPCKVLKGLQARATSQESIAKWQPHNSFSTQGGRYQRDIALNHTARLIAQTSIRYPSANATAKVGLSIVHDAPESLYTEINFDPVKQTITIDRSHTISSNASDLEKTVNRRPESAAHTLLMYEDAGSERMETLDLVVLFDKSILEVYVNERTIVSSRVYVNGSSSVGSVGIFAEGKGAMDVVFEDTGVWSGVRADMGY